MAVNNLNYYYWLLKSRIKNRFPSGLPPINRRWLVGLLMFVLILFPVYVFYLDSQVRTQFEGKRWELPARVYARPLELFVGKTLSFQNFKRELILLDYEEVSNVSRPGTYALKDNQVHMITRPFSFWDGKESWIPVIVKFDANTISSMTHAGSGEEVGLVRMDPVQVASIYPSHNEDRVLVKLDEVPALLVDILLAVEDRDFYSHGGIKPKSILRALWANLRAGGTVQGGSTLTQQLVKNFFLSHERTLWRKFNEAIMSLLLELHYEKDEILEAYLNEIYLGQNGKHSIHGFGLASKFYFRQPLHELEPDKLALLVALVKGASFYDPRRRPLRAVKRRNLILNLAVELNILDAKKVARLVDADLDVSKQVSSSVSRHPAFIDLVRRQLKQDYKEEDITSEGLQIFTTMDPIVQLDSEKALSNRIKRLQKSRDYAGDELQGAVIVSSVNGAEVQAVVGGKNPRFAGFNRALDAVRQIGSLIKPAVYLTALDRPDEYTLTTGIEDKAIKLRSGKEKDQYWQPKNFDHEEHGLTPLYRALALSYNLSTANLGMELGLDEVLSTLKLLGIEREFSAYPSILLGAISLSPLEVTQMYHTLANNGFRARLRAIRAVLDVDGQPLQRYPLSIEQPVSPESAYLINSALQQVVSNGTARSLYSVLPESLAIAGKTGTTDELRDSWFAGFTSNRLAVVWLGMDDNKSARLTGSSGALRVWGDIIKKIGAANTILPLPDTIEKVWINPLSNLRVRSYCKGAIELPFIIGSAPQKISSCREGVPDTVK